MAYHVNHCHIFGNIQESFHSDIHLPAFPNLQLGKLQFTHYKTEKRIDNSLGFFPLQAKTLSDATYLLIVILLFLYTSEVVALR